MAKKRAIDRMQSVVATASRTAADESAVSRRQDDGRSGSASFVEVPIDAVAANVRNVRRSIGDVSQLAQSIAEEGVLEPLVVRPVASDERRHYPGDVKYAVVMGERRLSASRTAGLVSIPVVVRTDITRTEEIKLMLIENLQRESLTPIDEALGYRQLIREAPAGERLSQRGLAKQIGMTQAHISRRLTLLDLEDSVQTLVADGRVGVDIAVNHLGKLSRVEQVTVAEKVGSSTREWEPSEIRKLAEQARHAAVVESARAEQRERAREVGAVIFETVDDLPEEIRADQHGHRLWDRAAIADAGSAENLAAVITDYRTGPEWYVRDTASITGSTPPADNLLDQTAATAPADGDSSPATAAELPDPSSEAALMAGWVAAHRRVKRPELEQVACWQAERIPDDEASRLVRGWLKVDVPFEQWRDQLLDDRYAPLALRAVYLYTVAEDLVAAREAPDSPAGRRTAARLAEQEGAADD